MTPCAFIYLAIGLAIVALEWPRNRADLEAHGWPLVVYTALLWPVGVVFFLIEKIRESGR